MAAMESQIQEFHDIVLRQRSVIGDLNREAQVAAAARNLVKDTMANAKASAVGLDSPKPSVKLGNKQKKLKGVDLQLQQELIMQYEELLRQKEAEHSREIRTLEAAHQDAVDELGQAHRQQMSHLRDVCQAQLLNFRSGMDIYVIVIVVGVVVCCCRCGCCEVMFENSRACVDCCAIRDAVLATDIALPLTWCVFILYCTVHDTKNCRTTCSSWLWLDRPTTSIARLCKVSPRHRQNHRGWSPQPNHLVNPS